MEYALIAFFIAVVVAIGIGTLGTIVHGFYQQGDDAVTKHDTNP